jgi:hypothetical protein
MSRPSARSVDESGKKRLAGSGSSANLADANHSSSAQSAASKKKGKEEVASSSNAQPAASRNRRDSDSDASEDEAQQDRYQRAGEECTCTRAQCREDAQRSAVMLYEWCDVR